MQKVHFSIKINAPKEKVWDTMFDDKSYREWSAIFMPGSYYVGNWEKGSKILFLGPDEKGKEGGMVSTIAESTPNDFISIKHLGVVSNGVEDTTSKEAKNWVGFENYSFKTQGDQTELSVDMESNDEFKPYFQKTWPKALQKLKELSEK